MIRFRKFLFLFRMSGNRPMHIKGKINRLTIVFLIILSIFSVSGFVGFSSCQPQKVATELLFTTRQKPISHIGYDDHFRLNCSIVPESYYQLKQLQQQAVIRLNGLIAIQFNHQCCEFLKIKSGILHRLLLGDIQRLHYKPSVV